METIKIVRRTLTEERKNRVKEVFQLINESESEMTNDEKFVVAFTTLLHEGYETDEVLDIYEQTNLDWGNMSKDVLWRTVKEYATRWLLLQFNFKEEIATDLSRLLSNLSWEEWKNVLRAFKDENSCKSDLTPLVRGVVATLIRHIMDDSLFNSSPGSRGNYGGETSPGFGDALKSGGQNLFGNVIAMALEKSQIDDYITGSLCQVIHKER